jgi:hypothetical protein
MLTWLCLSEAPQRREKVADSDSGVATGLPTGQSYAPAKRDISYCVNGVNDEESDSPSLVVQRQREKEKGKDKEGEKGKGPG